MKLFRYTKIQTDESLTSGDKFNIELKLHEYDVIKQTPKGYCIWYCNRKKWTNGKFAQTTKEAALDKFIYRQKEHIKFLNYAKRFAEYAIEMAKNTKP